MFLLVPAYPGSPGQKAVKRSCVCVCFCNNFITNCNYHLLYSIHNKRYGVKKLHERTLTTFPYRQNKLNSLWQFIFSAFSPYTIITDPCCSIPPLRSSSKFDIWGIGPRGGPPPRGMPPPRIGPPPRGGIGPPRICGLGGPYISS